MKHFVMVTGQYFRSFYLMTKSCYCAVQKSSTRSAD